MKFPEFVTSEPGDAVHVAYVDHLVLYLNVVFNKLPKAQNDE